MAIARSMLAFLGTDESNGVTITSGTPYNGAEVDVLGSDAAFGKLNVYLVFTSTVIAGSLDVTLSPRRASGQNYKARAAQWTVTPVNGQAKYFLGTVEAGRFMQGDVFNNGTGADATNVALLGELFKVT
jgi:hypothetical protein